MNFFKRKFYQIYLKLLNLFGADDVYYSKVKFYYKNNKKLDLDTPSEFMEKIQWLKLFHYTEDYGHYVDKYAVRDYVKEAVGEKYLVGIFDVYEDVDKIDFDALPNQFVMKGTHGSGYNIIVKDKSKLDIEKAKKTLKKFLGMNYYDSEKEKIYRTVKPRILVEKYLSELDNDNDIVDYKFFCFHGEPRYIWVKTFDDGKYRNSYYDLDWNQVGSDSNTKCFLYKAMNKPGNLDEMIGVARKLAHPFIFVRVDLYSIHDKTYFGELTFFPWAGKSRLTVECFNKEFGEQIYLPT
ncbi:MAG TPA: ATP-grasp fold amidoligase family protein [Flavobacterium sp.]|nr:ATP-grasp fold amidoligase family protein [Flavobacterium sp.]